MEERIIRISPKQGEAWRALDSAEVAELMFGGAKGGSKTVFGCYWCFGTAKKLIKQFRLQATRYPVPVGFMGRKRAVDFSDTTLETWKRFIPEDQYIIKAQDKEIVIEDRVKINYGGFDDEKVVQKFNSAEYGFFFIDQAEELTRKEVGMLRGSLRLKIKGKTLPYKGLFTSNPADCWLKEDFITNPKPGLKFIQALYTDNPYLPDNYAETLERAFSYDPILIDAYKNGNWDVMSQEKIVIPSKYITDLKHKYYLPDVNRLFIACDPSSGGDECVVYVFNNLEIIDTAVLHYDDTMKIVGEIMLRAKAHKIKFVGVDVIGIGKGVADRLSELGAKVIRINSAEKATDEVRFTNKRAELWWQAREKVLACETAYPKDEELRRQLSSVRYEIADSNGKIKLEPKDETKKRLGRSPDRADAFVYGVETLKFVVPEKRVGSYGKQTRRIEELASRVRVLKTALMRR